MEFKLKAVKVKPAREYQKGSKYDPILTAFIEGDNDLVTLSVADKDANYLRNQIVKRIEVRDLSVKVSVVNSTVYLEK